MKHTLSYGWRLFRYIPLLRLAQWPLSNFTSVQLRPELRDRNDESGPTKVHAIRLSGRPSLLIAESTNFIEAKKIAENLARILNIPLRSRVSGTSSTRQPDEFGLPLRERLSRRAAGIPAPTLPAKMAIHIENLGPIKKLTLPPDPTSLLTLVFALLMSSIFIAIGAYQVARGDGTGWAFGAMGVLAASIFLYHGILSWFPLVVTISPHVIAWKITPFFHQEIETASLEEVSLGPQQLILITDRKLLNIPYDFSGRKNQEIGHYIRDLIWHAATTNSEAS